MNKDYKQLITLTNMLNKSDSLLKELLKDDKETFSKNKNHINIALGLIKEISDISSTIEFETLLLNKKLHNSITTILVYRDKLFNNLGIVNTYKLYDSLKIDVIELKSLLNSFIN